MSVNTRLEHDSLGSLPIPSESYAGINTWRAVENFQISGINISSYPSLIWALSCVKQAAAISNRQLGLLSEEKMKAIVLACQEIGSGALHEHFLVDVIQGGAGTSTNMNVNEVVANRALEHLGHKRGDYVHLHPNEHVNLSQSTNDVYPTALKLATYASLIPLLEAMANLRKSFDVKAQEFSTLIKMGRTQLQDAVPMTLGQEFGAYAVMIGEDVERVKEASALICEINLGATAIGTGINAPAGYAKVACQHLRELSGIPIFTAPNLVESTQDCGSFVQLSGVLKRVAVKLSKICNDLRLLSSGPRAGLNEINLPARQAGSSIMPGKVNPVIPEVVNQVAFEVIGNDVTVTFAAEAGQLQLNAFEPIIAHSIFKSINHLRQACLMLEKHCVRGITANASKMEENVKNSLGLVTALSPSIGYSTAVELALEASRTGRNVYDIALETGLLARDELDQLLNIANMINPNR